MSQPGGHKRSKSENKNDPADSEKDIFGPLPHIIGTSAPSGGGLDKATTGLIVPDSHSHEPNQLKRKASSILAFSKATSILSSDPEVDEWKQKIHEGLLAYACKKIGVEQPLGPEDAQALLEGGILAALPWNGPSLLDIYKANKSDIRLKMANADTKRLIKTVLKIGLHDLESPFPRETVNRMLEKLELHGKFDLKKLSIDDEALYEAVGLFQQKRYWTGICTLLPELRYSEAVRSVDWWQKTCEEAKNDWNRGFVDRNILVAVFSRMMRAPPSSDQHQKLYAKVLAVVQTSGTGKSRLLKQLVNSIPGIYLNLANSKFVLPARDKTVLDFVAIDDMPTTRFICLFDAILKQSVDKMEGLYRAAEGRGLGSKFKTNDGLASAFQKFLDTTGSDGRKERVQFPSYTLPRTKFMEDVINKASETLQDLKNNKDWDNDEKVLSGPRSNWNEGFRKLYLTNFAKPWVETLKKLRAYKLPQCQPIKQLLEGSKTPSPEFPATFIFCIDELTKMELQKGKNRGKKQEVSEQLRHHFERAASFFFPMDVWFVYATPFPHLTSFESSRFHSSDRVSSGDYILPRPFCSMPFHIGASEEMGGDDVERRDRFQKKQMSLFCEPDHLVLYGRPMWAQYTAASEEDFNRILFSRLMGHYRDRMTRLDDNTEEGWMIDDKNPSHIFSIISVRAFLDPIVGANSSMDGFFVDNVLKHLCPLKKLDPDHGIIQLDQYMDPALAGAVTRFFTRNPENWPKLINALGMLLVNFPIRDLKGERGELVVRILLLMARDNGWKMSVKTSSPLAGQHGRSLQDSQQPAASKCFPLTDFLHSLLPQASSTGAGRTNIHPDSWEVLQKRPAFTGGKAKDHQGSSTKPPPRTQSLQDIFSSAYVNFTHFCYCEKSLNKDTLPHILANLLRQNAAMICRAGQAAWDLLIPYYNGDPQQPFDLKKVSAIAVQVKNRGGIETDFFGDLEKVLADDQGKKRRLEDYPWYRDFTKLNLKKAPLITILCEVGRSSKSKNHVQMFSKVLQTQKTVFGLRLVGSTNATYGCLNDGPASAPDSEPNRLQNAIATLLGYEYDPFLPHSQYEGDVRQDNLFFEDPKNF